MLICYNSTEIKGYIRNVAVQWYPKLVWKTIPALVRLQRNKKTRTCLWRFHKARLTWFKELPFLLRLYPSYHFSIHMAFLYKMLHIFKNYICKMQKSGYPCSRFSVLLSLLHPNSPPSSGLGKKMKMKPILPFLTPLSHTPISDYEHILSALLSPPQWRYGTFPSPQKMTSEWPINIWKSSQMY